MFLTISTPNRGDLDMISNQLRGLSCVEDVRIPYEQPSSTIGIFYFPVSANDTERVNEVLDPLDPALVLKAIITDLDDESYNATIHTLRPDLEIDETFYFDGEGDQEGVAKRKLDELGIALPVRFAS